MKTGSKKSKKTKQRDVEEDVHRWLNKVDLARLSTHIKFHRTAFPNLKPTDWDKLYDKFQKSKAISIRLPLHVIHKLKQLSLQKGIGYQTLIRMWLTEHLI